MTPTDDKLPPVPPLSEKRARALLARFLDCPICGQRFDTRDLDQVFHHGPEPHAPLLKD